MKGLTPAFVGEQIRGRHHYHADGIRTFASACGDLNPLHHDEGYARSSRLGGLIACGPEVTSRMMALTATHFSRYGEVLGLEFQFRFRKPVYAGDTVDTHWQVVAKNPKANLGGDIVRLEGRASNQRSELVVTIEGSMLVRADLG